MDGLEDDGELPSSSIFDHPIVIQKNPLPSSDGSVPKLFDLIESTKKSELLSQKSSPSVKPLWQHLSEEALLSKMDPNVVSSYRRALSSRQLNYTTSTKGIARSLGSSPMTGSYSFSNSWYSLPGCEDKVVIYFTSLRGIRKTMRIVVRSFRVPVDERDISMDAEYRKELQRALGGKAMSLPQYLLGGSMLGVQRRLSNSMKLENCLIFWKGSYEGSRSEGFEEEEGELKRCPDCNENGIQLLLNANNRFGLLDEEASNLLLFSAAALPPQNQFRHGKAPCQNHTAAKSILTQQGNMPESCHVAAICRNHGDIVNSWIDKDLPGDPIWAEG
ncbi:uncharacterized protein CFP56_012894 [Quercus suber]|uniref:Uncharacterized protein n=1 Tax=Quercus suber TaxID=58331 RepID=A0AAW0KXY2_QUESU